MLVRHERMFAPGRGPGGTPGWAPKETPMAEVLSGKRLQILNFISDSMRDRGYPPSVREIGEAVGLTSSATVHTHLAVLQREGYLSKDPSKPRAISVHFDPHTESRLAPSAVHNVPLVGDVAA